MFLKLLDYDYVGFYELCFYFLMYHMCFFLSTLLLHICAKYAANCSLWARCSHLRACVGASGLVVSVDLQLLGYGSILTAAHLQAILSKLFTCYILRPTQPPTLRGMGNE